MPESNKTDRCECPLQTASVSKVDGPGIAVAHKGQKVVILLHNYKYTVYTFTIKLGIYGIYDSLQIKVTILII